MFRASKIPATLLLRLPKQEIIPYLTPSKNLVPSLDIYGRVTCEDEILQREPHLNKEHHGEDTETDEGCRCLGETKQDMELSLLEDDTELSQARSMVKHAWC